LGWKRLPFFFWLTLVSIWIWLHRHWRIVFHPFSFVFDDSLHGAGKMKMKMKMKMKTRRADMIPVALFSFFFGFGVEGVAGF
jgi:hypothetical protein